jgi:hypothetical protein
MLDNAWLDAILILNYIEIDIWVCNFEYGFGEQIEKDDKRGVHQSIGNYRRFRPASFTASRSAGVL